MVTSLEQSEIKMSDSQTIIKYLPYGDKFVKIDPVDPEIIGLRDITKK